MIEDLKGDLFQMETLVVGIIGPIDLVEQIVNQSNPQKVKNIDYKLFIIQQVEDTRELDRKLLKQCDLLFFTGQMAYEIYAENKIMDTKNDESTLITLRFDGSALYKTLYELAVEHAGSLAAFTPFTIDVLSNSEVQESLKEVDILAENMIAIEGHSTYSTEEWADAHEDFYKKGKSTYAITCLTSVAKELEKRNVPVKRVTPTYASVNAALELLYANSKILLSNNLQTVAILIKWYESDRRPKNRYDFYRQKLYFEEIVLNFCEYHKVSLSFLNDNQANIYTNQSMFKRYTNDFSSFPLIKELEEKMGNKVSIGIGVGDENSKAEVHAEKAMKFAETKKHSCAYVTFPNGNISGPLHKENRVPLTFTTSLENERLKEVAKKSSLSAVTISRLLSLLQETNNDHVTVHQLAEAFDVSLRTSSRLLKQLEMADLAEVVGEEQPPGRGRPRKIYKLKLMA